ncbi:MAG: hypothetical protein WCP87_04100, partial [Atribacterota bacterium]
MRKNTLVLILSSLIFFILIPSISAQRFNPHLDWKEITTEHFQVIYQDSSRDVAVEAVSIAENMLPEMEQFLRTTLGYRPVIVCIDNTDLPNGSADPLQGEIRIIISEPYDFSLGTRFRSWLRLVIAHELTHLLHTTIASEGIARWRELLGFVVLPGVMQPMWAWEGYAVYGEKKFGEGGRTDDTTYDMYLREIALRDGFLSPYLVGGYSFLDSWPGRLGCYVYGSSVCQYIADTYGEEKLQEISHIRGKSFAIYGFEKALKTSLGVGSQQLWERWKEEKKKEYQQQKFEIEKRPLTPITYLTNRGYYSRGVNISPDGKRMVYFLKHPYYLSGIRLLERDQKVETLVVKGTVIGKPSFSTDGSKLVYAKVTEELYSSWCDLYIYDFSRKKETKITRQARAFSPVFWGDRVLFLRRNTFPEGIFVLDPVSGREEKWYTFGRDFLPMDGVLNPEGTLLALSGWHHG